MKMNYLVKSLCLCLRLIDESRDDEWKAAAVDRVAWNPGSRFSRLGLGATRGPRARQVVNQTNITASSWLRLDQATQSKHADSLHPKNVKMRIE